MGMPGNAEVPLLILTKQLSLHKATTDVISRPASNICKEGGRGPEKEIGTKTEVTKGKSKRKSE